ncbi:MAG: sigma-70 family RNA polymerase sigma factor, partial [Bacteroidota bacterium]
RKQHTQIKIRQRPQSEHTTEDGQYQIELQEFQSHLEKAINSMSPDPRTVFVLHRFSDMSYKMIAETLNISIKTVEKRMSKALKHLADQMIVLKR